MWLGTTTADIAVQAGAAVITIGGVAWFYKPLLVLAFNEQKAEVLGLNPRPTHFVMMSLITLAVVYVLPNRRNLAGLWAS